MNVSELLAALQAQHEAAAQAVTDLREQQARPAGELAEAEARVTELATARKVIESITPADTDTDVDTESATAYQRILTFFNDHPGQSVRARELHEHLDLPTDDASVNVTRARLGRLLRQGHVAQPGRGLYKKRT